MVLDGYKTYITAALLALLAASNYLKYIDDETYKSLIALLLGGGLAFLRMGIKNGK